MIDTSFSIYLLLIANALLVAAAAVAILRFQRALRESADFWASPTGSAMRNETPSQIDHGKMLVHEVAVLQKTVAKLCNRERSIAESPVVNRLPIEHAVRMVKHGASIEDLTQSCGLSIGEAQLMRRLHGRRAESNTAEYAGTAPKHVGENSVAIN